MSAPKPNGSITERLLEYLKNDPDLTATQLAHAIKAKPVSVAVLRLLKTGKIVRSTKPGPRGGKTYKVPPTPDPTLWDRLRDNDLL
jgi:predicted transcriptional regulator